MNGKPADKPTQEYLVLNAIPIEHPATTKQPLDEMSFSSKHDLDMRFTDCDPKYVSLSSIVMNNPG